MFDGVHIGHQFVLQHVMETAQERGLQSMAITFDHTLRSGQVLTPLDDKLQLLSQTGIDRTEVLAFTDELRQLTAREFMEQELKERLHVKVLLIGYDNRFGHNRTEGFDDYVRYGQELGIEVMNLPPAPLSLAPQYASPVTHTLSSSLIRQLLVGGKVASAAKGLGHPYSIAGKVIHGERIGTRMGFPTANIQPLCDCQLIPAPGVYAVRVAILSPDAAQPSPLYQGMMNIGTRPTFNGRKETLEVHIFQLHEDLYGQQLRVSFVDRLREEQRFETLEALKRQLTIDAKRAQELL
jgi:riboflavin kinase/FMN adenylyltransferase